MPNHLSTYLTPLLQNKTTPPHFHLTSSKKPHNEVWEREKEDGKEWRKEEKRSVETTQNSVGIRKRGSVGMMRKNKRKENRWTLPERY